MREKMLEVVVVSMEIIRPSSPTPLHLRNFKLSLLDQVAPRVYVPIILFYTKKGTDHLPQSNKIYQDLKKSLSETLALFYPLAGRIKEDDTIDCSDEGAEISHARIYGQLMEFLKQPRMEMLDKLLPCGFFTTRSGADLPLAIQVNEFDCGGVAIGVRLSHKIADGAALGTFMINWAAITLGENESVDATLVPASLFPPRSAVPSYMSPTPKNIVTKRLVFDSSAIAALRARGTNQAKLVPHPTRVEAVSALIWRCIMKAQNKKEQAMVTVSTHAVNLRWRMEPPLPDSYFGNLWTAAITKGTMINECNSEMQGYLEKQIRDAIRGIDANFIKELQGPNGAAKAHQGMESVGENYLDCDIHVCHFSSWLRFPFYEVDFGWGKPIWVSSGSVHVKNMAYLMETRRNDGLEIWVSMEPDEMSKLEQDEELLSFVSTFR